MLKKLLISCCATFVGISCSYGAVITWGAGTDNGFSEQNGTELAIGQVVRIGTFTFGTTQAQTDALIQQNAGSAAGITTLNNNFVSLGFARIGDVFGVPSNFRGATSSNTSAVQGKQLYIWALRSTNSTTEATAVSTATQIGIVYFPLSLDSDWAVPNEVPIPDNTHVIDLTDLTDSAGTSLVAGAKVVVGSFPTGFSNFGDAPNFGLAIVPEPSSLLLLCGAGLALSARRFRAKG
jgi:hypothetical protein